MSMNITYRVRWQLCEPQLAQLWAIKTKHEHSEAYRRFEQEYGMESLMIEPRQPNAEEASSDNSLWWGAVAYPSGLDFLEFEEFQEIVLGFVSELRRTFGGDNWEVFLYDNEEPAKWHEEKEMFY